MLIKLVRIGRDAELRSANGKPVLSVSVVYDIGYGQNKKATVAKLDNVGSTSRKKCNPTLLKASKLLFVPMIFTLKNITAKVASKGLWSVLTLYKTLPIKSPQTQ
ncbi:MAG: hypothetical protein IPG70_07115 [Moraxellaceae bacterium]|nr:hypothetical protein [Moraxellaceae bacterium]